MRSILLPPDVPPTPPKSLLTSNFWIERMEKILKARGSPPNAFRKERNQRTSERLVAEFGAELPVILETQAILTVPALMSAGLGGALVPSSIAKECRAKGIVLFSGKLLPINEVSIAWRRGRYQSCATAHFIETVREVLSERPGGIRASEHPSRHNVSNI